MRRAHPSSLCLNGGQAYALPTLRFLAPYAALIRDRKRPTSLLSAGFRGQAVGGLQHVGGGLTAQIGGGGGAGDVLRDVLRASRGLLDVAGDLRGRRARCSTAVATVVAIPDILSMIWPDALDGVDRFPGSSLEWPTPAP